MNKSFASLIPSLLFLTAAGCFVIFAINLNRVCLVIALIALAAGLVCRSYYRKR